MRAVNHIKGNSLKCPRISLSFFSLSLSWDDDCIICGTVECHFNKIYYCDSIHDEKNLSKNQFLSLSLSPSLIEICSVGIVVSKKNEIINQQQLVMPPVRGDWHNMKLNLFKFPIPPSIQHINICDDDKNKLRAKMTFLSCFVDILSQKKRGTTNWSKWKKCESEN